MAALPARLLVDLPNWLGDFVHALPAVTALRAANRRGTTTVLLPQAHAPLARLLGVNAIARPAAAGFVWARRHLAGRFDVALTARHSSRSKLLLAGSGAPVRLASAGRGSRALGLIAFPVRHTLHQRHDLDGALDLLGVRGASDGEFRLLLTDRLLRGGVRQRALLADLPRTAAILPASRGLAAKRYPLLRFSTVAGALADEGVAPVVFVGPGEEAMALELARRVCAVVVPTAWPLHEIAALLASCDAAVGNDSGLTHLAAAVGCPTVVLFGPTDPARTAPVGGAVVVRPDPVRTGAVEAIDPSDVVTAVRCVLGTRAERPELRIPRIFPGVAQPALRRYDALQRVGR